VATEVKSDRLDLCFCLAATSGSDWQPERFGFGEQPGHVHIERIREALGLPTPKDGKR
jgi:hypothetical protein